MKKQKNFDKIKLRNIKEEDFKKIVKIYLDSFSTAPFNEKWTFKTASERIKSYSKYSKIKTIFFEKEIIGIIIYYKEVWDKGDYFFIAELAIKKEFQRRGIGSYIMRRLELEAREKGYVAMALWTEKDSIASRMYKKLGYHIMKLAVRMIKELK